jgi:putative iron-regulated protein
VPVLSILRPVIAGALLCTLAACDRSSVTPTDGSAATETSSTPGRPASAATPSARTANPAWPLGGELLQDGRTRAAELGQAIERLLEKPTLENLASAQRTWRETAAALEQFHLFSRLGAVAPQDFQKLVDHQFNLTAWPIQPGYLDSFGEHAYSGIVFDIGVPITADVLREQHGMTDNSDATLGVYAMEFLLFGEQNNRGPLLFQAITELDEKEREAGYTSVEELPRNRRRELLRLQAKLLQEDVRNLQSAWSNSQTGQLQHKFEVLTPAQQSDLLRKAALALATEQLVTIANQGGASGNDLWQAQQLADRLAAQAAGLANFNSQISLGDQVAGEIAKYLAAVNEIRTLPPLNQQGQAPNANWKDAYTCLRDLIKALNPAPAVSETDNNSADL